MANKWLENYNNPKVSTGPGFVGTGYNTKGRNYSPAWGGQFAMGGNVPGSVGFTYARTDNIPSNGPYAKKTKASAKNGKEIPKASFGDYFQDSGQASIGKGVGSFIGNMILPGIGGQIGGTLGTVAGNLLGGAEDANKLGRYQSALNRNLNETAYAQGAQAIHGQYSSFMENGGEMQYYQNGLDWKPKSISKNGKVIKDDKDQLPQTGITMNTSSGTNNPTAQLTTLAKEAERKSKEKTKNKAIVADRKKNIAASIAAKEQPFSAQQLADVTQATGDKFRLFPNDPHSFIDEYLNPGVFIGNLASGMGRVPLDIQQGNYGNAALNFSMPAMIGAGEVIAAPYMQGSGKYFEEGVTDPLIRGIKKIKPGYVDKRLAQVEKGNQWTKDWYSNPTIQKRYDDWIEKGSGFTSPEDALFQLNMNNVMKGSGLADIPESLVKRYNGTIARNNLENFLKTGNVAEAVTNPLSDPKSLGKYSYRPNDVKIDILHPGFNKGFTVPNTTVHENIHYLTRGDDGLTKNSKTFLQRPFNVDPNTGMPLKGTESYDKYLTEPTEVHARIGELRRSFGLEPEQEIDYPMLNKIIDAGLKGETTVKPRWFELINNKSDLKWLFNNAPVVGGAAAVASSKEKKNGGWLNKYK